jgi:hypothetical protein
MFLLMVGPDVSRIDKFTGAWPKTPAGIPATNKMEKKVRGFI